jgi:hypothetical protein
MRLVSYKELFTTEISVVGDSYESTVANALFQGFGGNGVRFTIEEGEGTDLFFFLQKLEALVRQWGCIVRTNIPLEGFARIYREGSLLHISYPDGEENENKLLEYL